MDFVRFRTLCELKFNSKCSCYHIVLAMILSQVFPDIVGQMVCASVFGFTFGGYVTSTIIILKKIFEDLDSALGLVLFSCAVAGPVTAGMYNLSE